MKIKDIKLNKRRYCREDFAPGEFLIFKFIGAEWVVAINEAGKEVVLPKPSEKNDEWLFFDNEVIEDD
jgi:hypothetical protein